MSEKTKTSGKTTTSGLHVRPNDDIRNILIKKIITNVNVDDFMEAFDIIDNARINTLTNGTIINVKNKIDKIDYYTLFELYEKVNTEKKYKSINMNEIIVHINKIVATSKEKINELEYDKIVSLHEKVNTQKNKEIYKNTNTNMDGIIYHINKIVNDLNKYTVVPFHELESGNLYKSYEKKNGEINDIGKYTGESSTNSNNITDKFALHYYIFETLDSNSLPVRKKHTELGIFPSTHFILKNKDDSLSTDDINPLFDDPSIGGRKRRKTKKKTHSMRKKTKQKSKKSTRRKTKRRLSKK